MALPTASEPVKQEENPLGFDEPIKEEVKTDADLAELFRNASAGVEAEDVKPAAEAEKPAAVDTTALSTMEAKLRELEDKQIELTTQNDILRSGLLNRPQPQIKEPPPAPKGLFEELGVTDEDLNTGLRANPAKTIKDLVEKAAQVSYERARNEATTAATASAHNANAQEQAFRQDQAAVTTEYGELLQSNKEFNALANRIYGELTVNGIQISQDGTKWVPRAMYLATSTAYAQMAKAGKFAPAPEAENNKGGLKLVNRPKPPISPLIGDSTDTSKSQASLTEGLSPEDLSFIKSNSIRLGITTERYLKTFQAMRKKDPSFGRGI